MFCKYCGKIFNIKLMNKLSVYCSYECQEECPQYNENECFEYTDGFDENENTEREVLTVLRKEVFARDGWTCQVCGGTLGLHCHVKKHYDSKGLVDIDECVTLCSICHRNLHFKIILNGREANITKGVTNYDS